MRYLNPLTQIFTNKQWVMENPSTKTLRQSKLPKRVGKHQDKPCFLVFNQHRVGVPPISNHIESIKRWNWVRFG